MRLEASNLERRIGIDCRDFLHAGEGDSECRELESSTEKVVRSTSRLRYFMRDTGETRFFLNRSMKKMHETLSSRFGDGRDISPTRTK